MIWCGYVAYNEWGNAYGGFKMKGIISYLEKKEDFQSIIEGVASGLKEQLIAGVSGVSRSLSISTIYQAHQKKTLVVTHQLIHAQQLYDDLRGLVDDSHVYLYPVNELIATEMVISSPELRAERIRSLVEWLHGDKGILIVPVAALKRIVPPKHYWELYRLTFAIDMQVDLDKSIQKLFDMGYERVDMVTSPAEFSVRGGIIDVYPVTENNPIRIELFDDLVDSVRYFDANSQRSLENISTVTIVPARELLVSKEDMLRAANRLDQGLQAVLRRMETSENKQLLEETVSHDIAMLQETEKFQEMYKYSELFYEVPHSLLDYATKDSLVIIDDLNRVQEAANNLDAEEADVLEVLLEERQLLPNSTFSFDWTTIREKMTQQRIYLSVFLRHIPNTQPENIVNISSRTMQEFHGQMNLFKTELSRWEKASYSTIVVADTIQRAERVRSILLDYGMEFVIQENVTLPVKSPIITVASVVQGIELPLHQVAIVTEQELFKKQKARPRRTSSTITNAERIKSYQELKVGDFVVHRNHGIGKYIGIETLEVGGLHKDYLLIEYAGDDKLYVPIDQIDLVQKYVGSEGKKPRMYKLGGAEWQKVKRRVQSSVEDIADELIKLYAEREAQKGYAFEKDSTLQEEFELSFPYEETADQLRCIDEIKADMESIKPMDRLLCGDVGYGKTEVALRAMFKAISEGKQAALLVPTTILAQQHYQTMQERFQDYPLEIGLLSRFRTPKQQRETIEGLKNGTVDIVVGTHRLISKDIAFKDLGLLVVDEEQRFGVKHKEKIKQMKTNVDVLTLTATPIPRTLHMSMLGIRDLSVIETPPENRFPVQTYVIEYNRAFVKEAIERELARGGQVFVLYNRVETIEKVARELDTLVPDAQIQIAHGRMKESELEDVMFSFLEGESDVLVSTTIIETGVDIPNVNTLIVIDADHMGLSQLYQLRGRVGRSNRIAYAYFTYRKGKVLTEVSEKRLQAIKEFTELGSGFKIAMRDLSIRGAGNLLGAEQHGFIDSVGFDLYSQMLKEAIDSRKEKKPIEAVQPFNPELQLLVDAYIPASYIEDEKQKFEVYKRFQQFDSHDAIRDFQDELVDRFGEYPEEVERLFLVSLLKMVAKRERVEDVSEERNLIRLTVTEERSLKIDGAKLFQLANEFGRNVQLGTEGNKLKVSFRWRNEPVKERYETVSNFIERLSYVNVDEEMDEQASSVADKNKNAKIV